MPHGSHQPCDRPAPSAFFDEGYAGSWAETLPFLRFRVEDYRPLDDAGAQAPDRLSFAPLAPSHASGVARA